MPRSEFIKSSYFLHKSFKISTRHNFFVVRFASRFNQAPPSRKGSKKAELIGNYTNRYKRTANNTSTTFTRTPDTATSTHKRNQRTGKPSQENHVFTARTRHIRLKMQTGHEHDTRATCDTIAIAYSSSTKHHGCRGNEKFTCYQICYIKSINFIACNTNRAQLATMRHKLKSG